MARIYLGNLPHDTTEESLRALVGSQGRTVTKVDIKKRASTGKSRGFAFVDLGSEEEAVAAIAALNGTTLDGRELKVSDAKVQRPVVHDESDWGQQPPSRRRGGKRRY